MEIFEKKYNKVYGIILKGRFDAVTAAMVEDKLNEILGNGNYMLVIDLSNVDYISSAGLRVLLATLKQAQKVERGDLRLAEMLPQVENVFEMAGFSQIFKVYPSLEEAIASYK